MVIKLDSGIECVHSKTGRVEVTLYYHGGNSNSMESLNDVYRPIVCSRKIFKFKNNRSNE